MRCIGHAGLQGAQGIAARKAEDFTARYDSDLFEDDARKGAAVHARILRFSESTTIAACVMLGAAIVSLVIANTALEPGFKAFWETPLVVSVGDAVLSLSLEGFVNDFLMAIFFLTMGLEIKYEMTVGSLTDVRSALLPIIAAAGGVAAPIAIYLALNAGGEGAGGWGIPTATDIAFALGILSILGSRAPNGLKVFLSTLAIADDIIAIVIIAIFYGHAPDYLWLAMVAVIMGVLVMLNRLHVYHIAPYMLVGLLLWLCVYMSGIHATIAGVLLAFTIPSKSPVRPGSFDSWAHDNLTRAVESYNAEEPVLAQRGYIDRIDDISKLANFLTPPLSTLKKTIEPFSSYFVLPLFALANAGVSLAGISPSSLLGGGVGTGVFLGLFLGKPIGIMLASIIVVKAGLSQLPEGVSWGQMAGAAVLGGVGFTMSILVTGLALPAEALASQAKAAILAASACAGLAGFLILLRQAKKR